MTGFASYDGTRLAFDATGTGPRLLCLPGGPGRASAYLEDLGGLTASRTVVRLDHRATGHSEVPPDPSTLRFDRLADDVEALRLHLHLQYGGEESVDLLGHSAGCLVAQAYAAAHPERVHSLVLVTPVAALQGGTRSDVPALRAARAGESWYDEAAEAVAALPTASPAQRQALERVARPFYYGRWERRQQEHAATADTQMSKRAGLGFSDDSLDVAAIAAGLARVSAPVLVLGGERDAATGLDAVGEVAASFAHAEQVVLAGAGHFPWVDEPDAFRAAVEGFLGKVTA